jgi:hypothetical protein
MKKRILIIVGACCIISAFIAIKFDLIPYAVYPTKSAPHKLSLVLYSGFYPPNKPVITIKHYKNGEHFGDDILEIKKGVFELEPQSYDLPELGDGSVVVNFKLGDKKNNGFTLTYDNAEDFYKRGLLIYLATYDDSYVYFVSGKETLCYIKSDDSSEWGIIKTKIPSLKAILKKETPIPPLGYSGWKENKWVVNNLAG